MHSLKDLPTEMPDGLALGAIPRGPKRARVLVSRGGRRWPICRTARSSAPAAGAGRRNCCDRYPHLRMVDMRGNVDTRIRKALDPDGPYDAMLLALAGLDRLVTPRHHRVAAAGSHAAGAGAGRAGRPVSRRVSDAGALGAARSPGDAPAVTAERAFLHGLGGGCSVPVAALRDASSRRA